MITHMFSNCFVGFGAAFLVSCNTKRRDLALLALPELHWPNVQNKLTSLLTKDTERLILAIINLLYFSDDLGKSFNKVAKM